MIILHNQNHKRSNEFVEKMKNKSFSKFEIVEYPQCVNVYSGISTFPSVLIEVPSYSTKISDVSVDERVEYANIRIQNDMNLEKFSERVIKRQKFVDDLNNKEKYIGLKPDNGEERFR